MPSSADVVDVVGLFACLLELVHVVCACCSVVVGEAQPLAGMYVVASVEFLCCLWRCRWHERRRKECIELSLVSKNVHVLLDLVQCGREREKMREAGVGVKSSWGEDGIGQVSRSNFRRVPSKALPVGRLARC